MQKLKDYIENQELKNDPSWMTLFQSDIKSIFPKYELTKIQSAKVKLDRCRLMMDHLNDLLFLQKHKKESEKYDLSKISEQIKYLQQLQTAKDEDSVSHYKLDIIQKRDDIEKLCSELNEYGNDLKQNKQPKNRNLDDIIKSSKKWSEYFDKNCKMIEPVKENFIEMDKYLLSQTISIPNNCFALNDSLSAQVLFNRQKQKYITQKIKEKLQNPDKEIQVQSCYISQWNSALQVLAKQNII